MGKALQIRVSAVTWNEDLLAELWPQLSELAFGVPIKHERRGVLEMVRALDEGLKFMDWPKERCAYLRAGVERAVAYKAQLEAALADWDPREANRLSDALEDELDKLEAGYH